MAPTVFLIRHAQADYRPGRLYGRSPGVHLSETGRVQAAALSERLRMVRFGAIYTSPLERCVETAEAIAGERNVEIRQDEGLAEVEYGSWQGRTFRSLAKTKLWTRVQLIPSRVTFPGGESIRELQARGVSVIESIVSRHRRGTVAVVSHADMIKAVAAHYLGMHLDMFQRLVIDVASVSVIAFGDGFPRVLRVGDAGPFGKERTPAT